MLKLRPRTCLWVILPALVLSCLPQRSAHAFAPLVVIAAVQAGVQVVGAISDATSEVSGTLDAFQDLYSEIGGDTQISDEGRRTIEMIQEIQSLATEAGYTADEVEALTYNRDVKSLQGTLRALTQVVRAGKHVVRLAMKLEKKAQMAQLEAPKLSGSSSVSKSSS